VLGKPEVVIGDLANVSSTGFLEDHVAMFFTVPLAFLKWENINSRVLL
jgi:hypothetical protein